MGIHLGGPIRGISNVTLQPDIGTNTIGEVFTLTSSDGSVLIEGDALTDTIDFKTTAAQNAFKTVAGTAGTNPVADSATDTLSLLSSDSKFTITGDSVADSLDFTAPTLAVGPASATDNAIVRFDGTTGKLLQNSGCTIDDSNNVFIPSAGTVSCPGAGANSEKFGASTTAAGANSVVVGNAASSGGADNVVIGKGASNAGGTSVVIGYTANATDTENVIIGRAATGNVQVRQVAIGDQAYAYGVGAIAIGRTTIASVNGAIAIGNGANVVNNGTNSITIGASSGNEADRTVILGSNSATGASSHSGTVMIGQGMVSTAASQLLIGCDQHSLNDSYFGRGVVHTSPPASFQMQPTGGSGTNIAGCDYILAGGKATGNAVGGDLIFSTSDAGASGTTLQSLTAKMTLTAAGLLGIGTASPNSTLNTSGSWAVKRTAQAASANSGSETIIGVTSTAAPRTITLRTADCVVGRVYIVKDESGAANTNNITIATEGAELIDGQATVAITANYGVARVYSNGTDWFVI